MKTIYEDEYYQVDYDAEKDFMVGIWKRGVFGEEALKLFDEIIEIIDRYKPKFRIDDNRKQPVWDQSLKDQIMKVFMDRAARYFTCLALVVPESAVSRMSVKKAAEAAAQLPFDYEEFHDYDEAEKWILSKIESASSET